MDKNKIIIVVLIIIIAVLACLIASQTLFTPIQQDNVIDAGIVKFNTTNATNFTALRNETGLLELVDDNGEGRYTIYVMEYDKMDSPGLNKIQLHNNIDGNPTQDVNGVVVYTSASNTGKYAGEPRYASYIMNKDTNTEVYVSTPDANETAKIISSIDME